MNATRKIIRVKKEDAAFIYFILESFEGMTAYSTLVGPVGAAYCDLELLISPGFEQDLKFLLQDLSQLYFELSDERPSIL